LYAVTDMDDSSRDPAMDRSCPSRKEVTHARPDSRAGHFGVLAGTWNLLTSLLRSARASCPRPRLQGYAPPIPCGRIKIVVAAQAPIGLTAGSGIPLDIRIWREAFSACVIPDLSGIRCAPAATRDPRGGLLRLPEQAPIVGSEVRSPPFHDYQRTNIH
jgi:hypothetical protein